MRAGSLLLAAGLLGCEVYSTPPLPACPGRLLATFNLSAPLTDGGTANPCQFAGDPNQVFPSVAFSAALHVDADGGAALCRPIPHARHWLGTLQADRLDVSSTDVGGGTPSCSCALSVVERVVGDVQRDGGVPVTFAGELVDTVSPADPAELDAGTPDGGVCNCFLPCEIRYAPLQGAAADGG